MEKSNKEIVDSQRVAEKQREIDALNRRLEQIQEEKRKLNQGFQGMSNLLGSNQEMIYRAGVSEGNQYFSKLGALNKETASIQDRISKLNSDINAIGRPYNEQYTKSAVQEKTMREIEKAREARELKAETFKKVKRQYKKGSLPLRVLETLRGRRPNWSKVKNYTQEELDYILKVSTGNTVDQKKHDEKMVDVYREKGKHYRQIKKLEQERHWDTFVSRLKNRPDKVLIEYEEEMSRRGR